MPGQKKAEPRDAFDAGSVAADVVATEIQRAHAAVLAAVSAGYDNVEGAMKHAEEAVAQAVHGATEAFRRALEATNASAGDCKGDGGKRP